MDIRINLAALAHNYRLCRRLAGRAETAAVVKADAYGLGMAELALVLWREGCRSFFVALTHEGAALRALLPDAAIYLLNGLPPDEAELAREQGLRPCLASLAEAREWIRTGGGEAALHLESGMNRLGLSAEDSAALRDEKALKPSLIMSHLACAEEEDNPMNALQRRRFEEGRRLWHGVPASLANSAGLMLGAGWHFDMVRPGIALYGGAEHPDIRPVVRMTSEIAQIHIVKAGESVGYGADFRAGKDMQIAVVPAGYADGVPRGLWRGQEKDGGEVAICGHKAPVAGRISMDMLCVDVSALPRAAVHRGAEVEILGGVIKLTETARAARTIPHDILTGLGARWPRHYADNALTTGTHAA